MLRHWICAGHIAQVPQIGDFFTVEIGNESAIVVRGRDEKVRALINVCRHRGSRVCTERSGKAIGGGFTCPYHAWNYGLDGSLRASRLMPEDFDQASHGLKQIHLEVIEGLIFLSFADMPLGLDHVREALAGSARVHGWADAKIAYRETYAIAANWKLAIENYVECYHCAPAHREFAACHAMARGPLAETRLRQQVEIRTAEMSLTLRRIDHWGETAAPGQEPASVLRSALNKGVKSGTADGGPVAPLMGNFSDYDGGVTFFDVLPCSDFLAYPDYGVIYRFIPKRVDATELEVIWLVRGDARENVDYDRERLTWLWHVTSLADKHIIEMNQLGVNSAFYEPGPYAPMETHPSRFIEWYFKQIN
jgi:Rieske 2Fe-2S family protein